MLRLVTATLGPLPVAPGAAAGTQTVEAYNAGDGSLSLSLSSSAPWISTAIGASRNCTTPGYSGRTCIPLQFTLNTSGLVNGMHTGIVRVSDPGAIDAPQTITVTVRVGGIDLYAAPGTIREAAFTTSAQVNPRATTQDGGPWLAVALDGTGSFRFSYPYRVRLQPPASQPQGTYNGTVTAGDVTVPVTMRVTTQPIAVASPEQISVRLAQGAPGEYFLVSVVNAGQGSLGLRAVSSSGGEWLGRPAPSSAFVWDPGPAARIGVIFTVSPGSLMPGIHTGSISIESNAANGTVTVPVSLEVVAKGPPAIQYQGVVDNGTYRPGDTVARGGVLVVLGEQFSFEPPTVGKAPPLAYEIGGATVRVNGRPAPMYYSSYGQLAFQMPVDAPLGTNLVQVQRDGMTSNTVTVEVAERAPRLLLIGGTPYGAIHNASDFSIPMPAGAIPGVLTRPARPGDTLILYAIGLGPTTPSVPTGEPAPSTPLAQLAGTAPTVSFGAGFGAIGAAPSFAGLSPSYAGLYQVNVQIPSDVPKGVIEVFLVFSDMVSNRVQIVIQ